MKLLRKKINQAKESLFLKGTINHRVPLFPNEHQCPQEPILLVLEHSQNVALNFFRHICEFSVSEQALPYLQLSLLQENLITFESFADFVYEIKNKSSNFRKNIKVLKPKPNDSEQLLSFKRAFKSIAIAFLKFFSADWIFQRPQGSKVAYLNLRFKLLRKFKSL